MCKAYISGEQHKKYCSKQKMKNYTNTYNDYINDMDSSFHNFWWNLFTLEFVLFMAKVKVNYHKVQGYQYTDRSKTLALEGKNGFKVQFS